MNCLEGSEASSTPASPSRELSSSQGLCSTPNYVPLEMVNAVISLPSSPRAEQTLKASVLQQIPNTIFHSTTSSLDPTSPLLIWTPSALRPLASSPHQRILLSSFPYKQTLIQPGKLSSALQQLKMREMTEQFQLYGFVQAWNSTGAMEGWDVSFRTLADVENCGFGIELDGGAAEERVYMRGGLRVREWWIVKPLEGFGRENGGKRLFSNREEMREVFRDLLDGTEEGLREWEDSGLLEGRRVGYWDLRSFFIQRYLERPLLLVPSSLDLLDPSPTLPPSQTKFHLRAYALISPNTLLVYPSNTQAIFASELYSQPTSHVGPLLPHLSNASLDRVYLLDELEGRETSFEGNVLSRALIGRIQKENQRKIVEAVVAAVQCGTVELERDSFELFGIEFLLTEPTPHPPSTPTSEARPFQPCLTLLGFKANPQLDFPSSSPRLKSKVETMIEGVVQATVAPFFVAPSDERVAWEKGDERFGWVCVREGELRGSGAGMTGLLAH